MSSCRHSNFSHLGAHYKQISVWPMMTSAQGVENGLLSNLRFFWKYICKMSSNNIIPLPTKYLN